MFDLVTKNKRLVYVVLGLIILTFAFFGVESYFTGSGNRVALAEFGKTRITEQEFSSNFRQTQDRLRQQAQQNPQLDTYLNSPEFKRAVLDDMIQRRLLLGEAGRQGMAVSVDELRAQISGVEAFYDENGNFSIDRYERLLRAQNMTPAGFESQIEQDLILERVRNSVSGSAFLPDMVVERLVRARAQEREVSQVVVSPADFRRDIEVSDDDARKYFEENKSLFKIPERAKVEYLVLTPEVAAANVKVSDEELRKAYETRIGEFQSPEERRASHILIAAGEGVSDEEKGKAGAKADDIYQQLKESPSRFAELAKANSDDPGSAEEGGDLGFFQRGSMVKEFEDAVFSGEVGKVLPPVQTQYGYHIIRVDGVKAVVTTPFEKVRDQLAREVRESRIQDSYNQAAQQFMDLVYTDYDSLKPAADALNLTIQRSDWVSRTSAGMNPLLNNPKLLEAVFSPESLEEKRNTQAFEVQPNTLVSARVIEHESETDMPFEDVVADIKDFRKSEGAIEAAKNYGEEALKKLQGGEAVGGLKWSKPGMVTLLRRQGLHAEGMRAVFGADVSSLPAYVGMSVDDGRYVIYKITKVVDVESVSPSEKETAARQLEQMFQQEELRSFVGSLRERANVRVDESRLFPQEQ